jgi:phospholipid transport system substrate-binding protein
MISSQAEATDADPGPAWSRRVVLLAALALLPATAGQAGQQTQVQPGEAPAAPLPPAATDAAADPAAPVTLLLAGLNRIMQLGRATPFRQRFDLLEPVIDRAFNLPMILQTSVGLRWSELPPDRQAQLLDVFRRYTVASYVANFDSAADKLELLPDRRMAGADAIIETQLVASSGTPTRIDYVMRQSDGAWKAIDVLLEGSISRVAVQRSDFRSLLGSGDGSALIASLRQKVVSLSGGALAD